MSEMREEMAATLVWILGAHVFLFTGVAMSVIHFAGQGSWMSRRKRPLKQWIVALTMPDPDGQVTFRSGSC